MVLTHSNLFRPTFVLMTTIPRFRMQVAPPILGSDAAAPIESCLDLGLSTSHVPGGSAPENSGDDIPDLDRMETPSETPANSKKKGSFNYDREKGGYSQLPHNPYPLRRGSGLWGMREYGLRERK